MKKFRLIMVALFITLTTGCAALMDLGEDRPKSTIPPSTEEGVISFDHPTGSNDSGNVVTSDSVISTGDSRTSPGESVTEEEAGGGSTGSGLSQTSRIIIRGQLTPP